MPFVTPLPSENSQSIPPGANTLNAANPALLLPLETWRAIFGINPFHFWQLENTSKVPIETAANPLVREYSWSYGDTAGRQDIREAIWDAQEKLRGLLGYSVAPRWTSEIIDFGDSPFVPDTVQLREGHLQQIGVPSWAYLADAPIALTDTDGDGLFDTFSGTVTIPQAQIGLVNGAYQAGTNPTEVIAAVPPGERPVTALTDELGFTSYATISAPSPNNGLNAGGGTFRDWLIRPVEVAITATDNTAGTVTLRVRGRAWQVVKPSEYEGYTMKAGYPHTQYGRDSSGAINPDNAGAYLTTLSLYKRVIASANTARVFVNNPAVDTRLSPVTVNATIDDRITGIVRFNRQQCEQMFWNCCAGNLPRRLEITYEAGYTDGADLGGTWQLVVARLSAALLMRSICGNDAANAELMRQMTDYAHKGNEMKGYPPSVLEETARAFGVSREGAIYAWQQVAHRRHLRGFSF